MSQDNRIIVAGSDPRPQPTLEQVIEKVGGWFGRQLKASRESTLFSIKLNSESRPSRTYRRRFQFMEAQFSLDKAKLGRQERRRLAREMVKAQAHRKA